MTSLKLQALVFKPRAVVHIRVGHKVRASPVYFDTESVDTESVDTESVDKSARSETEITCIEKSSKW